MATTVDKRPDSLPEQDEVVVVSHAEVWAELDREARRLFGLTADEFLRIFQDPPERYHGDPVFNSLCFLADLVAQPSAANWSRQPSVTTTAETQPDWLPDEHQHVVVTREGV